MEEEDDRRTQDLMPVGRGCHGRHYTPPDDPPQSGHLSLLKRIPRLQRELKAQIISEEARIRKHIQERV